METTDQSLQGSQEDYIAMLERNIDTMSRSTDNLIKANQILIRSNEILVETQTRLIAKLKDFARGIDKPYPIFYLLPASLTGLSSHPSP